MLDLTINDLNNVLTIDYNGSRQAAETMESIIDFGSLDLETYTSSQSRDISEDGKYRW